MRQLSILFLLLCLMGSSAFAQRQVQVCSGSSVQLQTRPFPGFTNPTYSWAPTTGLNTTTPPNTPASPAAAPRRTTIYTVTITEGSRVERDTIQVVVATPPNALIRALGRTTFCEGDSVALEATAPPSGTTYAYQWFRNGAPIAENANRQRYIAKTVGVYSVRVTDNSTSCAATSLGSFVDVYGLPTARVSVTDTTICAGPIVVKIVGGSVTYDNTDPTISVISSSAVGLEVRINPTESRVYRWVVRGANGCNGTRTTNVTLRNAGILDAGRDTTVCFNQLARLNARITPYAGGTIPAGVVYSWTPNVGFGNNPPNQLVTSVRPSTSTTYTLTAGFPNGCVVTDTVRVNIRPEIRIQGEWRNTLCACDNFQVNITGGAFYTWSPNTYMDNQNIGNPRFALPCNLTRTTLTYTLRVSDGNNCTRDTVLTFTVNPKPTATVRVEIPAIGCSTAVDQTGRALSFSNIPANNTLRFTGILNEGTSTITGTWRWFVGPGPNFSNTDTLLTPDGGNPFNYQFRQPNRSYYVTGIGRAQTGCADTVHVSISTIDALPVQIVRIVGTDRFCENLTATLRAEGGVGDVRFQWAPAFFVDNPTARQVVVRPLTTTTFTVLMTDNATCFSNTATHTLTIIPAPDVTVRPSDTLVCFGRSATLRAFTNVPNVTYRWTVLGSGTVLGTTNQLTVTPTVNTRYLLQTTDPVTTCFALDTVLVRTQLRPVVTPGDTSAQPLVEVTLRASGGVSYRWAEANNPDIIGSTFLTPTNQPTVRVRAGITQNYTVTVTDANGCTATATSVVRRVTAAPQPDTTTICQGQSTTLSISGGTSYVWRTSPNGPIISTERTIAVAPTVTTTYYVDARTATEVFPNIPVHVIVNPRPRLVFRRSINDPICGGQSVTLTVTGASTYTWLNPGVSPATGSIVTVSPTTTTTYSVRAVNITTGCDTVDVSTVVVVNNPDVNVSVEGSQTAICENNTTTLFAVVQPGTTYQWQRAVNNNFTNIPGETGSQYTQAGPGTYRVVVTRGQCTATSEPITIFGVRNTLVWDLNTENTYTLPASTCTGTDGYLTARIETRFPGESFMYRIESNNPSMDEFLTFGADYVEYQGAPGVYNVTAYDAVGCFVTTTLTIPQPIGCCQAPDDITYIRDEVSNGAFVTLNWTPTASATGGYIIRYRLAGNVSFTQQAIPSPTASSFDLLTPIKGLYDVQLIIVGDLNCRDTTFFQITNEVCEQPVSAVTMSSINSFSAIASWPAVQRAVQYQVRFRELGAGDDSWVQMTTNHGESSVRIFPLDPLVTYEVQVRTLCRANSNSDWSPSELFTTPFRGDCPSVLNEFLTVSDLTFDQVTISWEHVNHDNNVTYEFRYRKATPANSPFLDTVITTGTSVTITGLESGEFYVYQVRTFCEEGTIAEFIFSEFRTELRVCNTPNIFRSVNVTATNATVIWEPLIEQRVIRYEVSLDGAEWVIVPGGNAARSYTFNNLVPLNDYNAFLRVVCSESNISDFITHAFSTQAVVDCPSPIATRVFDIRPTTAIFAWGQVPGVRGYQVSFDANTWFNLNPPLANGVRLTDLTPNSNIVVFVRSICEGGVFSDPSVEIFSTGLPVDCTTPTDVRTIVNPDRTVTVTWQATPAAVRYQIEYGIFGSGTISFNDISTNTFIIPANVLQPNTSYQVTVRAVCSDNEVSNDITTSFTSPAGPAPVCDAPTNLRVSNITTNSAQVNFNGVPNATSYTYVVNPGNISASNLTVTSFNLGNLNPSTTYTISVTANCNNGLRSSAVTTTFRTQDPAPVCPRVTGLRVSNVTANTAELSWNDNDIYLAYVYSLNGATDQTTILPNVTLRNLNPNTSYTVQLRGLCDNGDFSEPVSVTFRTLEGQLPDCPAPSNLRFTNITATSATMLFDGVPVHQFYAYALNGGSPASALGSPIQLEGLTPNTTYVVVLGALCETGELSGTTTGQFTTLSGSAPVGCAPPINVQVNAVSTTTAVITFAGNTNNFLFSYSVNGGPQSEVLGSPIQLSGLQPNTEYTVSIRAICFDLSESQPRSVTFRTNSSIVCAAPSLTAGPITTTTAVINWTAVPGAVAYAWSIPGVTSPSIVVGTSVLVTGLQPGTSNTIAVLTVCENNVISDVSVITVTTQVPQVQCDAPTNLRIVSQNSQGVTFSWNRVNNAASYALEAVIEFANGNQTTQPLGGTTETTFTLPIFIPNPDLRYALRVASVCGPSDRSVNTQSPFVSVGASNNCPSPNELVIEPSFTTAIVSWDAVPGATGYLVEYTPAGLNQWRPPLTPVQGTTAALTGLTPNTSYEVRVRTVCNDGVSTSSVTDAFTTLQLRGSADIDVLEQVSVYPNPTTGLVNVSLSAIQNGTIELTVVDAIGRTVLNTTQTVNAGQNNISFDLTGHISAGVYTLLIDLNNTRKTARLVVR